MRYHILSLLCLLSATFCVAQETEIPPLIINEVQVSNIDQYLDGANCYGSWIELYNPSEETISLRNMFVSDGVNEFRLVVSGSIMGVGTAKRIRAVRWGVAILSPMLGRLTPFSAKWALTSIVKEK